MTESFNITNTNMKQLILLLILILTSFVYVPTTEAHTINTDWCDAMYVALHFEEVPPSIYLECRSRFQWNINREKSSIAITRMVNLIRMS